MARPCQPCHDQYSAKEAHDFKTNSNVYFALLIFSKTEQLRELAVVFPWEFFNFNSF